MTEESSTTSHLSVAVTTAEDDETQTAGGNSGSLDQVYMGWVVIVIGIVGTAGNGLILYALVASKEHKKHPLIVNQNALDLFSSFFLILNYAVQLSDIKYTGASGYWLCVTLTSGVFLWCGLIGSVVNLAIISIERYLKVVRHAWSNKHLRPWMTYSAMAFAWFAGIITNIPFMLETSGVIDGVCYFWVLYKTNAARIFSVIWYIVAYYVIILVIFVYCYWHILATIRHQAKVMASHGSSTFQAQSHQIQTNVIKTMFLVCVFYAIAWLPCNVYYVFIMIEPNLTYINSLWYASLFAAFIYTCANPFIYATKYDPVRGILRDMIPCKKTSVQST